MVTRSQRKKTIVLVMDRPEGGWNFTNKPKPLLEGLPDKVRGTSKKGKHVSSSSSSSAHSGEGLPVAGKAVSRSGRSTKEGFKRLPDKVRGTSKKGIHVSSSSSSSAHSGEGLPVAGKAVSRSGRSTKEGFKLEETEGEKAKQDALKQKFEVLCKVIKDVLGEKVEKVVVSDRVVDSPCCLVTGDDVSMAGYVSSQKTMEINPENSIIEVLRKRTDADKNDESVKYLVLLLFDLALLTYGFSLDEPKTFANRIHMLLKLGLGIDDDDIPALEEARN